MRLGAKAENFLLKKFLFLKLQNLDTRCTAIATSSSLVLVLVRFCALGTCGFICQYDYSEDPF